MIKVVGCRILLRPFKMEEQDAVWRRATAAGIKLPEEVSKRAQANIDKGTVLQIGPSINRDYAGDVQVSDVIGFAKFGGKFIEDPEKEGEYLLVINDEDVICIIQEA